MRELYLNYTDHELRVILDKIWRRTRRDLGGAFDKPTFRIVFPHRAEVYERIENLLR